MIGDLEPHHPGKRLEMVPDMAPCDRAAFDPNQPVMLEIVEGFDPEACAGHAREHDRHRDPAAHQKDDRLHDDLRKLRLPDPVEIGRAHVRTPVTKAQIVYRLLIETNKEREL